jgi:uracil phosphoribosyltransferase
MVFSQILEILQRTSILVASRKCSTQPLQVTTPLEEVDLAVVAVSAEVLVVAVVAAGSQMST